MAIQNTAIPATTPTTIYTSSNETAITTLIFCNTTAYNPATPTADTVKLTLHAVPYGNPVGDDNMIINEMPIPAGETFTFDTEKMVLENGDYLRVIADVSGLSATVSYMSV